MKIPCKILSYNPFLYKKFELFLLRTPFFILTEEGSETKFDILIWDADSIDADNTILTTESYNCSAIIVVTSLYSESILSSKSTRFLASQKVFYMHKNIAYEAFIDEIDTIVEKLNT